MTTYLSQTNWTSVLHQCKRMQRKQTADIHDTEDALSAAVCDLLCSCCDENAFTSDLHLCRHLVRAAAHNLMDERRRRRKFIDTDNRLDEETDNTDTNTILELPAEYSNRAEHILTDFNTALSSLPTKNVMLFMESLQGYTAAEIAAEHKMHVENVTSAIRRSRAVIRRSLREYATM